MDSKENVTVTISEAVKSGVVCFLEGIRAFIPASKLSLNYVEEDALKDYVGKKLEVRVITADEKNKKLVLSAREILREKADEERAQKVSNVQVGLVAHSLTLVTDFQVLYIFLRFPIRELLIPAQYLRLAIR